MVLPNPIASQSRDSNRQNEEKKAKKKKKMEEGKKNIKKVTNPDGQTP